jgi:hypothetical protein
MSFASDRHRGGWRRCLRNAHELANRLSNCWAQPMASRTTVIRSHVVTETLRDSPHLRATSEHGAVPRKFDTGSGATHGTESHISQRAYLQRLTRLTGGPFFGPCFVSCVAAMPCENKLAPRYSGNRTRLTYWEYMISKMRQETRERERFAGPNDRRGSLIGRSKGKAVVLGPGQTSAERGESGADRVLGRDGIPKYPIDLRAPNADTCPVRTGRTFRRFFHDPHRSHEGPRRVR